MPIQGILDVACKLVELYEIQNINAALQPVVFQFS